MSPLAIQPQRRIALPSVRFDSSAIEPRGRAEAWHAGIAGSFDVLLQRERALQDFSVKSTTWQFDDLVLTSGRFSAQTLVRQWQHCRRDVVDHYVVSLADAQRGLDVDADGQRTHLASGQLTVKDMARPFSIDHAGCDSVLLFVPRQRLEALLPGVIDLHGAVPQGPFAVLAGSHLRSLARMLPKATSEDAPHLAKVTLHLIAASLSPTPEELAQNHLAIDDALRRDICSHIDAHLAEPEFSAQSLCQAFKISRATLYRLFEPFGGVATEIRKRRLQHAHSALATEGAERSVGRIAERLGFKSQSQFSRAFREQFGYCPTEVSVPERRVIASAASWQDGALEAWLTGHPS